MEQSIRFLSIKKIIIFFIFAVITLIAFNISSYGRITISNTSGESVSVTLKSEFDDKNIVNKKLDPGQKISKLVKKSNYIVSADSGNKRTISLLKINRLSRVIFKADLREQKQVEIIGVHSDISCSFLTQKDTVAFIPCQGKALIYPTLTLDGKIYNDLPVPSSDEQDSGAIFKPYLDGALRFTQKGNKLDAQRVSFNGASPELLPEAINFEAEEDIISSDKIATNTSVRNNNLVAIISGSDLLFSEGAGKTIKKTPLNSHLVNNNKHTNKLLIGDSGIIYVLNLIDYEKSKGDSLITRESVGKQKILRINTQSNLIEEIDLDPKILIREASIFNNDLVLTGSENGSSLTTYQLNTTSKKVVRNQVPSSSLFSQCQTGNRNMFIYDNGVYAHEKDELNSYLIYKETGTISTLNCIYGEVYITSVDSNTNNYIHRKITNEDLSGQRDDSFFPISDRIEEGIISATMFRDKIYVKLINSEAYENRNIIDFRPTNATFEEDKSRAYSYLSSLNIDLSKYTVEFTY